MLLKGIKEHLNSVNESYYQHMRQALAWSGMIFLVAVVLLIHAIAPCFFTTTGSTLLKKITQDIIHKRDKKPCNGSVRAE